MKRFINSASAATSQELAAEVVSLRTERTARKRQEQTHQQTRRTARVAGAVALLCVLTVVGALWYSLVQSRHALRDALHPMTTLPIQKLALIPDNVPVHIDSDTLAKLAKGAVSLEDVSVDTRTETRDKAQSTTMFNNEWTIVKSGDTIMVRGWATAEFALNISNDATGALFSSRPGWLPANNLVPAQVPVFRLEKQDFARYLPDGKGADSAATSVLMAVNVADTSTAVGDLVQDEIVSSGDNFIVRSAEGWSHVEAVLKNNVVNLQGNATTPKLKKLAGEVAEKSLRRLHLPYTVTNKLIVAQTDQ